MTTKETVIDFSKLPKSENDINFRNAEGQRMISSGTPSTEDDDEDKEIDSDGELEVNTGSAPDFEVELDEIEEDILVGEPEPETPPKKEPTLETPPKPVKPSRSQERIRELANERKAALERDLKNAEENRKLREENEALRKKTIETEARATENDLNRAKMAYAEALESGDNAKIADANVQLQQVSMRSEIAKARKTQSETLKSDLETEDEYKAKVEEIKKQIQMDPTQGFDEAVDGSLAETGVNWLKRNRFIFADEKVMQLSGVFFEQLQEEGMDPNAPETYTELEDRLGAFFPNLDPLFKKGRKTAKPTTPTAKPVVTETPPPASKPSRSTDQRLQELEAKGYRIVNGKVRVRPTAEDVARAKAMNISVELQVKNRIAQEQSEKSGSKYTQIFNS